MTLRTSIASIAIIHRETIDGEQWLAQWNSGWQAFSWVGGHKRDNESFYECLVREVFEELGLRLDEHYRVNRQPLTEVRYTARSERAQVDTEYGFQLFDVVLQPEAEELVERTPQNRWLTRAEIETGRSRDGQKVSSTMSRLMSRLQPKS